MQGLIAGAIVVCNHLGVCTTAPEPPTKIQPSQESLQKAFPQTYERYGNRSVTAQAAPPADVQRAIEEMKRIGAQRRYEEQLRVQEAQAPQRQLSPAEMSGIVDRALRDVQANQPPAAPAQPSRVPPAAAQSPADKAALDAVMTREAWRQHNQSQENARRDAREEEQRKADEQRWQDKRDQYKRNRERIDAKRIEDKRHDDKYYADKHEREMQEQRTAQRTAEALAAQARADAARAAQQAADRNRRY